MIVRYWTYSGTPHTAWIWRRPYAARSWSRSDVCASKQTWTSHASGSTGSTTEFVISKRLFNYPDATQWSRRPTVIMHLGNEGSARPLCRVRVIEEPLRDHEFGSRPR